MSSFYELFDQFCVFGANDGMLVFESGQAVEVVHIADFVDIGDIAEVYRLYVALNLISQFGPIEAFMKLIQLASVCQVV